MLAHHLASSHDRPLVLFNTAGLGVVVFLLPDPSDIDQRALASNDLGLAGLRQILAVGATSRRTLYVGVRGFYLPPAHVVSRGVIVAPRAAVTGPGSPGRAAPRVHAGGDARRSQRAGYRVPRAVGPGRDAPASIGGAVLDVVLGPYYVAFVALLCQDFDEPRGGATFRRDARPARARARRCCGGGRDAGEGDGGERKALRGISHLNIHISRLGTFSRLLLVSRSRRRQSCTSSRPPR